MSAPELATAGDYLEQLRFLEHVVLPGLDHQSIDAAVRWLAVEVLDMPNVRSVLESLLTEIEAREST